jgi:hypothetical protein
MKIAVCGSLNFTYEMKILADELAALGFEVQLPLTSLRILNGELTLEQIKKEKETGEISKRVVQYDAIRKYWDEIKMADAILVANFDKNGIKNYIGGNVFLEMGFAHVLNKPIYLLNEIPKVSYRDEIAAMQPLVINHDFSLIKEF